MKRNLKMSKTKLILAIVAIIFVMVSQQSKAQILPSAINADPSAKSISQTPLSSYIVGTGVLQFRFSNESTSSNSTGQIPANSVRLTISFPGKFAYTSVNSIPKFVIEDADDQAFGVVHLINNQLINEGEVIDLLLNVRALQTGAGTVTFNADRTTPIVVANKLTTNDNTSSVFTASGVLAANELVFTANAQACTASLSWQNSSEINLSRYEVEVDKADGAGFTNVANVPAIGNSANGRSYQYAAQMQSSKTHLYRLKIVDRDGSFTYSDIARISNGCSKINNLIIVYPSPVVSQLTVSVPATSSKSKGMIFDASGRQVMTVLLTGTNTTFDVSRLTKGMYVIRMEDGSSAKFIKAD